MRKLILAATALAFAGTAYAADMPVKAPSAPLAPPVPTWTGAYIGANVGWVRQNAESTFSEPAGSPFAPAFAGAIRDGAIPASTSQDASGFLGGLTLGFNFQSGSFVYGVEADAMWTDLRETSAVTTNVAALAYPPILTTTEIETDWLATFRARGGFLVTPQTLLFATGGLAVGHVKGSTTVVLVAPFSCAANALCASGSESETRAGWTAGAGVEHMFAPRWTAKIEYLYYDLGTLSHTADENSPGFAAFAGTPVLNIDTRINGHIVRAGANFKF